MLPQTAVLHVMWHRQNSHFLTVQKRFLFRQMHVFANLNIVAPGDNYRSQNENLHLYQDIYKTKKENGGES
jgi:hypothetical protein